MHGWTPAADLAAGIAAGGLAGAATATAQPTRSAPAATSTKDAAPPAVNNLGLSTTQARYVQRWIQDKWNYNGALDGQLGTQSWKIDGIAGTKTRAAFKDFAADSKPYC